MTRRAILACMVGLLALACASRSGARAADQGSASATAGITQPAVGALLSGVATLKAQVKRKDKKVVVGMLSFYAGETKIADACPGAAAVKWDTRQVPDGAYALTVRVWDYDRRTKKAVKVIHVSEPVAVTVRNCER